jgi:HAD superfamily hydrolase (TIGR01450 family)
VGWVLDLDGVVWLGDAPIPGAAEAVARLRAAGESVAFVTNNSYGRRGDVAAKLARHGIDPGDDVVTSAMAVAGLVAEGERVLALGGPGLVEELRGRGAEVLDARDVVDGRSDPDAVTGATIERGPFQAVVVGYHADFDYLRLTAALAATRTGARLLASNDDATYPTVAGPIPGGGSIVAAVATASGMPAEVAGKPHRAMVDLVRDRLGNEGIGVGDRPDTDGRFAVALGYRFALVLSGVTTAADLPTTPPADVVAPDLAALVDDVLGEGAVAAVAPAS